MFENLAFIHGNLYKLCQSDNGKTKKVYKKVKPVRVTGYDIMNFLYRQCKFFQFCNLQL